VRIAVCFGGPSVEHDVSIISAQQLMAALEDRHDPVPIYLARDGRWWTGGVLRDVGAFGADTPRGAEPVELRLGSAGSPFAVPASSRFRAGRDVPVDAVINAIHGTGGEDGALLGALEQTDLPYAGGGVGPAAAAMDKALAKLVFHDAGIEVNPHHELTRERFTADPSGAASAAAETVGLPCFAKPSTLGSSIGVSRCTDAAELEEALELCFELDRRALVEPSLDDAIEINAAVLGRPGGELRVSVLEQPVKRDGALSFEDKYLRAGGKGAAKGVQEGGGSGPDSASAPGSKAGGSPEGMAGADRLIPAPIDDALGERVRQAALAAHRALGFAGVVRYDFFVDDHESDQPRVILNEANTVPGSFAFYLYEPDGLAFPDLAEALVEIALAEAAERRATTRTFESVLLSRHQGGSS
jgi:D-alanine-D-alanine ligase